MKNQNTKAQRESQSCVPIHMCHPVDDVNTNYNLLLGMPGTAHSRRPWNRIDAPKWKIGRLYNHDDSNEQQYYRVIKQKLLVDIGVCVFKWIVGK